MNALFLEHKGKILFLVIGSVLFLGYKGCDTWAVKQRKDFASGKTMAEPLIKDVLTWAIMFEPFDSFRKPDPADEDFWDEMTGFRFRVNFEDIKVFVSAPEKLLFECATTNRETGLTITIDGAYEVESDTLEFEYSTMGFLGDRDGYRVIAELIDHDDTSSEWQVQYLTPGKDTIADSGVLTVNQITRESGLTITKTETARYKSENAARKEFVVETDMSE